MIWPSDFRPALIAPLAGLAVILVVGGCSGSGNSYSLETADLAQRFLPTNRTVDYHPDSLGALTIEEKDGSVSFKLDSGYQALHQTWSCTYQNIGSGRRGGRPNSYATFWSRELSLASLQPELGINTLTRERAREQIEKRETEYQTMIQIDVYWFEAEGNSILTGPGSRVELNVRDTTLRPSRENHGPLREAFLPEDGNTSLYRRNTFYFPRVSDSGDVLAGADGVELHIDPPSSRSRFRFAWTWPAGSTSSAHRRPQRRPSAHPGMNLTRSRSVRPVPWARARPTAPFAPQR